MPKITENPKDPDYHKKYYQTHKEQWNNKPKKKVEYCLKMYGVEFTTEDIETLGNDYRDVARFLRDAKKMSVKYRDFLCERSNLMFF
jgi:hypothetical protein